MRDPKLDGTLAALVFGYGGAAPPVRVMPNDSGTTQEARRPTGKKCDFPQSCGPAHAFATWEYLHHYDGPGTDRAQQAPDRGQGLHLTRFKKGWNLRHLADIQPDRLRLEREKEKEMWSQRHAEKRRTWLQMHDKRNGYNLLNGEGAQPYVWKATVRHLSGDNSAVLAREEHIRLRQSHDRFFIAQYSGPRHEYRQKVLASGGLLKPVTSSAIGWGRADLPSYGVDDQFSRSDYTPKEPIDVLGLYDYTRPGAYTPRKTGNDEYHFLYPLQKRPERGRDKPTSGPSVQRPKSCDDASSSAKNNAAPLSAMSHDQRRDTLQDIAAIQEVRALS